MTRMGFRTIEELATQFCCRVLAHLGLEQKSQFRWMGEAQKNRTPAD